MKRFLRPSLPFANRSAAGRVLAQAVAALEIPGEPVVLALPRGGVPVAVEVARALRAPLDLVFVRKIGAPGQPELAAAAVVDGSAPEVVVNENVVAFAGVTEAYLEAAAEAELREIERRRVLYLKGSQRPPLEGRTLIVIDDGVATGASIRAALLALRRKRPATLILAVPVAPADTLELLRREADQVICLATPSPFYAIGAYYRDFHQVSDSEVIALMAEAETFMRREESAGSQSEDLDEREAGAAARKV